MSRTFASVFVLTLFSCKPDLGDRDSLVTRPQVLAVRGDPPEAKPGAIVRYEMLVATPNGPVATPLASWAFCTSPKLLTENGAASAACLRDDVSPLAEGTPSVEAAVPEGACSRFGPEIASANLRPRDPDVTGGFYQPLRVTVFESDTTTTAFGLERLGCRLANAGSDVTSEFARRYTPNVNPELLPLAILHDGLPIAPDAVPRGAKLTLRASWPPESAEPYVVYDLASQTLVSHRETMRVSWFATSGVFDADRTGRSEDELESFTENGWTAPSEERTTHMFVVLRDARGGVAYAVYEIRTR